MPTYCDVALPVPLETIFTYRNNDHLPAVGGRVLVPFRNERMVGVVLALHDNQPTVTTKTVVRVLDEAPVLDDKLRQLAEWIAHYYLAPLGEVLRSMLPLEAEVKRTIAYSLTEAGLEALYNGATEGSSLRSRKPAEGQAAELRVLDFLANRGPAHEPSLRAALGVNKELLSGLIRKKWVLREDLSDSRDAARTVKIAALAPGQHRLTAKQQQIVHLLEASGGEISLE